MPFLETPKLILTFIQTIDIDLKQRLMKNWNRMYIAIKNKKKNKNILAEKKIRKEKSTNDILCVFKSFQYISLIGWWGNVVYSVEKSQIDNLEAFKPLDFNLLRTSLEVFIDQKRFLSSLS